MTYPYHHTSWTGQGETNFDGKIHHRRSNVKLVFFLLVVLVVLLCILVGFSVFDNRMQLCMDIILDDVAHSNRFLFKSMKRKVCSENTP